MERKSAYSLSLSILLALSCSALGNGGDVPIDSARGNYEGADNIHWYMQETLQYELWTADPPLIPIPQICNQQNSAVSCSGASLRNPLTLRSSNAAAPIAVKLEVDNRIDFGWRYALKQLRDVNRMLSDSGVHARLFVSDISSVNVVTQYSDSVQTAFDSNVENRLSKTQDNDADLIVVVISPDSAAADASVDLPVSCAAGTQGPGPDIQVIATACADSIDLAHQLGHTLGLGHEPADANGAAPFVATGRGFIDQATGVGTVMSTASQRVALFSSPSTVVRAADAGVSSGDGNGTVVMGSAASNSVEAANATAWTVALANESAHSPGFDYDAEVYWDTSSGGFTNPVEEVQTATVGALGERALALVGRWSGSIDGAFGSGSIAVTLESSGTISGFQSSVFVFTQCPLRDLDWGVRDSVFRLVGTDCEGTEVTLEAPSSPDRLVGTWIGRPSGNRGNFDIRPVD